MLNMSTKYRYDRVRNKNESHSGLSAEKRPSTTFRSVSWSEGEGQPDAPQYHEPLIRGERLSPKSRAGWRSRYLRSSVLLTFASGFVILAALLAGLYYYSDKHQGLAKAGEHWHYLFKFGPTARKFQSL